MLSARRLCIWEDMGGMIDPVTAAKTVAAVKAAVGVPVHYHSHCTGGMTEITYWEVARAGADVLDVDYSALALGTSHPAAESMIAVLAQTPRSTGLDYTKLIPISNYLREVRRNYADYESKLKGVDINVVRHQIPGGMRSNLESQLTQMNAIDRLDEVLEEVVHVRADLGYPPLGTPFSQMCGAQASANVLTGERYRMILRRCALMSAENTARRPAPSTVHCKRRSSAKTERLSHAGRPTSSSPAMSGSAPSARTLPAQRRMC